MTYDVVIVGGGISGLALAAFLKASGSKVLVLEQQARFGGVIETSRQDGFLLEIGPNSTMSGQALLELNAMLGIENAVLYPTENSKRRLILSGDTLDPSLVPVPTKLSEAIFTPLLSPIGKLRLCAEPLIARSTAEDESVAEFFTRRLGSEFTQAIVAPALNGIWAADISRLSVRSALPKLWDLEQSAGSLIGGAVRKWLRRLPGPGQPHGRRRLFTYNHGLGQLMSALVDYLGPHAALANSTVLDFSYNDTAVTVNYVTIEAPGRAAEHKATIRADNVVICTEAAATSNLLAPFNQKLSNQLHAIPYAPLGVTHLAIRADQCNSSTVDGFGFLIPPRLKRLLLGAIFSSSIFERRAPDGFHLITCFSGGALAPQHARVDQMPIAESVAKDVQQILGLKSVPVILNRRYYRSAIPNYSLGHFQLQESIRRFEHEHPWLRCLGNWYSGVSVSDRVEAAKSLAHELGQARSRLGSEKSNTRPALAANQGA